MKTKFIERIYGTDGLHKTCYLTKISLTPQTPWGQLYLHIFHRGDADPDPHDHPWEFWTFPLRGYRERFMDRKTGRMKTRLVTSYKWHHRDAYYVHRVLGPLVDLDILPIEAIFTLVWCGSQKRRWGFWIKRSDSRTKLMGQFRLSNPSAGDRIFLPWRSYIYGEMQDCRHDKE